MRQTYCAVRVRSFFLVVLVWLSVTGCEQSRYQEDIPAEVILAGTTAQRIGQLNDYQLNEISGIAPSSIQPNTLWGINDSGNASALYRFRETGELVQVVKVDGVDNTDWEDLTGFSYRGKHYLLIADVGDNRAWRSQVSLILVAEPSVQQARIKPLAVWSFQYPNGARDVESVAYDANAHQVLLLSKRESKPLLYQLPLPVDLPTEPVSNHQVTVMQAPHLLGALMTLPQPTADDMKRRFGDHSAWPTAMDVHNNQLLVLTYKNAYVYKKPADAGWESILDQQPNAVPLQMLKQQEAIMWYADGAFIYLSEGVGSPILKAESKEKPAHLF